MALELIGERWSLLIVRELMLGPRRFGELRASLNGISANVLTQRLETLERSGVLARRKLPPPASVQVYELSRLGYAADRLIMELGRWAAQSPLHDPTLPLSPASLMLSLRTMFDQTRAVGLSASIGFQLGSESFLAQLKSGGLAIRRDNVDTASVVFTGTAVTLAAAIYGGAPIISLTKEGTLAVTGDTALAERFVTLFPLPPKLS